MEREREAFSLIYFTLYGAVILRLSNFYMVIIYNLNWLVCSHIVAKQIVIGQTSALLEAAPSSSLVDT